MLKNYLIVTLRSLRRRPGHTAINILGLAAGVACCLFLLMFVRDELSYDRFHEHAETIYRVNLVEDEDFVIALSPTKAAPWLKREIPEVVATTRVEVGGGVVRVGDKIFDERGFYFADSTFFDVFTFPLIAGDASTALARPNTVVLTRSTARKYFGDVNPLGKRILRNNEVEFEVTGVMEDVPANSHMQFDFLASFASREFWVQNEVWWSANFFSYVRLVDGARPEFVQQKIDGRLAELRAAGDDPRNLVLQPLTDIHLSSGIDYELDASGQMAYVLGFSAIAVLILLIACINYMNLATARSTQRTKEVGLRKSLGAMRTQLIGQFYGEAVLLTLGALVLAAVIVSVGLPWFNDLSAKQLTYSALLEPGIVALTLGVFVVVTLVAGSYPALLLSNVEPVRALRGRTRSGRGTAWIRKGLVVVQFGISAFLIVATLVVMGQLRFMQNRNLGFDKEHVVEMPINDPALSRSYAAIRQSLEASPAIVAASAVTQIPGQLGWTSGFRSGGMSEDDEFSVKGMPVEAGVVEALGLKVIAGRDFPESPPAPDSAHHQFLLNETLVRRMGWTPEDAIGRHIDRPRAGIVIGVVRDFNFNTLHVPIEPLAIWYQPDEIGHIIARIEPGQSKAALKDIHEIWAQFAPDLPLSYRFIDDVYNRQYADEQRMSSVMTVFAVLAILIACLGLLGLASFTAEKRTREIGIRKVLGASVPGIIGLLSRDFLVLVSIAFVLTAPLTWMAVTRWLGGFAYQVEIGPGVFVAAGAAILAIALVTVSTQAIRAAVADPVNSLRYE